MTSEKKIFILMPAYNAASTIKEVFPRIPKDFLPNITEFLVINDASKDQTQQAIL